MFLCGVKYYTAMNASHLCNFVMNSVGSFKLQAGCYTPLLVTCISHFIPDLIRHIYHFQYNVREVIRSGVGFGSGSGTETNVSLALLPDRWTCAYQPSWKITVSIQVSNWEYLATGGVLSAMEATVFIYS